jgi:hypothetical protein
MKGGKPSVSPWGKPIKDGSKTVVRNCKKTAYDSICMDTLTTYTTSFPLLDERRYGTFQTKEKP